MNKSNTFGSAISALFGTVITGANALNSVASALNETAMTAEELAATGHVMATNNKKLVSIESNANCALKLKELTTEFGIKFDKDGNIVG